MPSNKKKKKSRNTSTTQVNTNMASDDSDDNKCLLKSPFIAEEGVKTNFADEFDLFSHFFGYLRKTDHLLTIVKSMHRLCEREPQKLFENTASNYSSDPKFLPTKVDNRGNNVFNISSKITIKFNKLRKRFVETNAKIKYGEALSVERCLILTDKPNTTENGYNVNRCHHCLRVISYFVTCPYCDVVIYCSYMCRDDSWHEHHVWECYGLQRCFWDVSSPEYVAMRILFLGARYEFEIGDEEFQRKYDKEADIHVNDDFSNPYKFLYRYSYNLKNKSKSELGNILQKCSTILIYLVECSHFFARLSKLPRFAKMTTYELYMHVGGLLTRHYGQAEMHRVTCDQIPMVSVPFFDRVDFASAGIFVSESIFAANCKPNAVHCIRDNFIIIKATEPIEPGQKVTVNWRPIKEFCPCEHCLEIVQLNSFICTDCGGAVMPKKDLDKLKYRNFDFEDPFKHIKNLSSPLACERCPCKVDPEIYINVDILGQDYITQFKRTRDIQFLQNAIETYRIIFQPFHVFYSYLYIMVLDFYITNRRTENPEELADILTKYLNIVELHFGKYSKALLYGRCSMLLQILDMYKELPFPTPAFKVCRSLLHSIKVLGGFHCISYKIQVLEQVVRTNYRYANLHP